MTGMDESTVADPGPRLQFGRIARLVLLVVGGVVFCVAWQLVPPFLSLFWAELPRDFRIKLEIGSLQGLLVAYALVLVVLMLGLVIVAGRLAASRGRLPRRRWLSRLVLLDVSLLLGVVCLEVGASVWMSWLHRAPAMVQTISGEAEEAPVLPGEKPPVLPGEKQPAAAGPVSGSLRILVIGESSARGEPYHPWLSVGQIVGWQLEKILPGRPVQVDMQAEGGATLEEMHQKLATIPYRPDALILFAGHNEFQGRWSWERNPPYYIDEQARRLSPVELVVRNSPWCRLILETLDVKRASLIPRPKITRKLVDRPTCTEEERARILADFRRRLGAIASYCEALGTVPIFIVPGSNDGDYEPSRSAMPPSAGPEERASFAHEFLRVRELEQTEPARAIEGYRRLLEQAPGFAETHYRLARLLEAAGQWDEAREHYVKAREYDVMPMRCPEDFRQVYRDLAREHPSIVLVESAATLGPLSPHGILDDHLYHDAQHPTFRGYLALAQAVLDQLHDRQSFGWPSSVPAPRIDPADCARHFQLDKARWVTVCERSAWFYDVTAYTRYDPTERLKHAEAYKKASREIESGKAADQAGLVGLGIHPALRVERN